MPKTPSLLDASSTAAKRVTRQGIRAPVRKSWRARCRSGGVGCFSLWERARIYGWQKTKAPAEWEKQTGVLADINADHSGDRGIELAGHGVLLVFGAPCQLRLLAGQEHGRTIPLADRSHVEGRSRETYGRVGLGGKQRSALVARCRPATVLPRRWIPSGETYVCRPRGDVQARGPFGRPP
jgi:hypothetical protein